MNKQMSKRLVLGEGEAIGHKHVLECNRDIEFTRHTDCLRLQLRNLGILTHDEHAHMVLPVGFHRRYHQVEFNPMDNTVNRVFD